MENINTNSKKTYEDILLTKYSDYPEIKPEKYLLPEDITFGELEHPSQQELSRRKHMSEVVSPVMRTSNYKAKDDGIYGDIVFMNSEAEKKFQEGNYRFSFRAEDLGRTFIVHNWDMVSKANFEKILQQMNG